MKWDKRTLIFICSGVTLAACALSIHALVTRLSAVERCVVAVDNRLSSDVAVRITDVIEQQVYAGKSYADIAAAVIKEFPCVNDIALHRCAPGVVHCDITSVNPLIQINDMYIVSNDGLLIAPDNFSRALLCTLHTMRVDNLDERLCMSSTFITTVQKLIPSLLDAYDARWVDDNKLVLQEKQTPHFSLICNGNTLPDARLLACCQQLKNDVCANKIANKKAGLPVISEGNDGWAADIRFEHQIILHACQGGVVHG